MGVQVHGEVDENIDFVLTDEGRGLVVIKAGDWMPGVGSPANAPGDGILVVGTGVAEDFKSLMIMVSQQREGKERLTVFMKMRREITDAQPAVGRAVVGKRLDEGLKLLGVAKVPFMIGLGVTGPS